MEFHGKNLIHDFLLNFMNVKVIYFDSYCCKKNKISTFLPQVKNLCKNTFTKFQGPYRLVLSGPLVTVSPPQYRTQTCQLPFTHNPTRLLSKNAGLLVSLTHCQIPTLTTFAASLKLHTNSSSNQVTHQDSTSELPHCTLASAALTIFHQTLLLYC